MLVRMSVDIEHKLLLLDLRGIFSEFVRDCGDMDLF
jgi:hypothetical protein